MKETRMVVGLRRSKLNILGLAIVAVTFVGNASARDTGHWNEVEQDPAVHQWYQGLMQPDVPTMSCCGEADAYWCDDYYASTVGGTAHVYCKITDDRQDAPRNRPHIDIGTEFEIPPNKLKWDKSNPTGHGVLFLSRAGYVYCYVQPGGV